MSLIERLAGFGSALAAVDDRGNSIRYDELIARADTLLMQMRPERQLVVLEGGSSVDWLVAYVACLRGRHPMLIVPAGAELTINHFEQLFSASIRITAANDWQPQHTGLRPPTLHPDLALLLSTSGSTGSTKCVRLSAENLSSNAASIADYLGLDAEERGTVNLPTHYSYGLSIVNSHLFAGATLLLTNKSVIDKEFWSFLRDNQATSFAGVPHVYDLLQRIDLGQSAPPSLRYFTQAGGRLPADKAAYFLRTASDHGWLFFIMYGQTEATARIAYLPPEQAEANPGSIGVAIPGGKITLRSDDGTEALAGEQGELIYFGPNVMMGYAAGPDDLSLPEGDGQLATGDIGRVNANGLLEITGRKSRFIKIFGNRLGLDDIENGLNAQSCPAIATGIDDHLLIVTREADDVAAITNYLMATLKLPAAYFTIRVLDEYPLLATGKIDYAGLKGSIVATGAGLPTGGSLEAPVGPESVETAFRSVFGAAAEERGSSFNSLGGDSLNYVLVVMALQTSLPYLPDGWEAMSIDDLSILAEAQQMDGGSARTSTAGMLRKLATIDVARGLCMLLVVVMHVDTIHYSRVVHPGLTAHLWDMVTSIAKPMRMPTFFLLSGLLISQAVWRPWREIARGRIVFLLYIFVLWSSIIAVNATVAARLVSGEWKVGHFILRWANGLLVPQSLLWFLYALVIYFVAARLMRSWPLWLSLGLAAILSAIAEHLGGPPFTYIAKSLLFYLVGVYLPRLIDGVPRWSKWPVIAGLAIAYLASCLMIKEAGEAVIGIWLPGSVIGICLGLTISQRLADTSLARPIIFVGRHTLPIYLIHQILVTDWHELATQHYAALLNAAMSNQIVSALYPILLDTSVIMLSLGIYAILIRCGLFWLFELPRPGYAGSVLKRRQNLPV